ncbi:MAG: hypothetical protein U0T68_10600 [Ferruginibacter sp.]
MHNNRNIQAELEGISPLVAGISNRNVYSVPEGYFEAMLADVLQTVQHFSSAEKAIPGFAVPEGYFEGLAGSIMNRIKTEISEESGVLQALRSAETYTVPDGYFDALPGRIISRIQTEKEEGSVLLEPVKHINPYRVPAGYFEELSGEISRRLTEQQPAKVIIMQKRSSFFRYAAAAVITGLMGLSIISLLNNRQNTEKPSIAMTDVITDANKMLKEGDLEKQFSSLSDTDIVNYLEENGEDVNAALVASVSEDKNLPDEEEYIFDDKTLDNLLNELNIKDNKTTTN